MGTPFLGEIKIVSFNFAPKGWAQCNGQFLPINQNQALFSILGTTYGGNGQTTFALPDFRGRSPYHVGSSLSATGQTGGQEAHTLLLTEMPAHNHFPMASTAAGNTVFPAAGSPVVQNNTWATTSVNPYAATSNNSMLPAAVSNTGGSQPHPNMQPYLVLIFIIALQGIFPSRN
jgi:microcystin-dependent protein